MGKVAGERKMWVLTEPGVEQCSEGIFAGDDGDGGRLEIVVYADSDGD